MTIHADSSSGEAVRISVDELSPTHNRRILATDRKTGKTYLLRV